jgi:hypothetical protein
MAGSEQNSEEGVTGVAGVQEHPTGKRVKIGEETRRSADLAVSEKLQNGTE